MTTHLSFDELLAPRTTSEFFRDYWQKRSLHTPSSDAIRSLVGLADIDFLAASLPTPDRNWIRVVKAGSGLAEKSFCTDEGFVSLPKLYAAYRAGYTVQLSKMHKRWASVGRLCRESEKAFTAAAVPLAHRIGSHLYLTPAHSVGLEPHYDSHDVIVVQVQGVKRWKVYGTLEEFPLNMQLGDVPRDELPPLEHDIQLQAGEILYIPRGVFHEALAEDTHSVHITLDIFPYTWTDLLYRITSSISDFREALPVGSWADGGGATEVLRDGLAKRVDLLKDQGGLDEISVDMLEEFLGNIDTLPSSGFEEMHRLPEVSLNTVVSRRPGAFPCVIDGNGDGLQLRFPGSGFKGPQVLASVFEQLSAQERLTVSDLPDFLAADSKVEIAKELIREGFLEIVAD